jgi:K+/H+ antiporter YhaU regulatory subunit KhtT
MRSSWQLVATDGKSFRLFSRLSGRSDLQQLPSVATTWLHNGSVICCRSWRQRSELRPRVPSTAPVPDTSPWLGKTLAEAGFRAKTGITVIAILREPEPVSGARPDDIVQRGDTLVTVGKAGQYAAFRRILAGES